jgi:hypothetical protein
MPTPKYNMIYNWKKSGLIYDNYDELYETYIKTTECEHCKTEFTKNNKRCLDHDHTTGLFRKIVCHRCNTRDSYIKYPNGNTRQEYQQEYRQANKQEFKEYQQEYQRANKEKIKEYQQAYRRANKERIKERDKQKIECECGSIVRRPVIARHKQTKKHSDYIASSLV